MQPGEAAHSSEFDLVLACLRWPLRPEDAACIRRLAQQPIEWPHLLQIVRHHQVAPLVSRNLSVFADTWVPQGTHASLRESAVENARLCFQRIAEVVRLTRLFREQQIGLRIFKGIPLAMAAFEDPALRGAGDIDLLIGEADISPADRLLLSLGYLRVDPQARLTPRRMRSYIAHQKDLSYDHPGSGISIDLHWRLFRNRWLLPEPGLDGRERTWLELGGERIPTLPFDQLFLYLCVHGALDGWLRLKWLADVGALVRRMPQDELAAIAKKAREQGILPEFSAALILCEQLLGAQLSGSLEEPASRGEPGPWEPIVRLNGDHPKVARILRLAHRLMSSNDYRPIREEIPTTEWFMNEFSLQSSLRYRSELLCRSLYRPRMWQTFDLPDLFFPLYALLSPWEWLVFHLRLRSRRAKESAGARGLESNRRLRVGLLVRLFGLAPSRAWLLLEAASMLVFFRIALKFVSVQRLTAWMGAADQTRRAPSHEQARETIRQVEWAVGAVVRHSPFDFVCFPQSLAAYFLLRRRHIASTLFYGIAREDHHLKAHTWIKVGDRTVVGGEVESQFTVLATFP